MIKYVYVGLVWSSDLQPVTLGIFDKILGGFNQQIMGLSTWRTQLMKHFKGISPGKTGLETAPNL